MRKPKRIQRKRVKGWRMPPGAKYVGRPSKWGNPHRQEPGELPRKSILLFKVDVALKLADDPGWLEPLRGFDLACWCRLDAPCHADVLLELANR